MSTKTYGEDLGEAWDDPALAGLLMELRHLADEPTPVAGPALAAVLDGADAPAPMPLQRSRTSTALLTGLLSAGLVTGGISAAAADELPAPVQRVVARVVNTLTPFDIPARNQQGPAEQWPEDDPLPQHSDEDDDVPATEELTPRTDRPDVSDDPSETESADDDADDDAGGGAEDSTESGDRDEADSGGDDRVSGSDSDSGSRSDRDSGPRSDTGDGAGSDNVSSGGSDDGSADEGDSGGASSGGSGGGDSDGGGSDGGDTD